MTTIRNMDNTLLVDDVLGGKDLDLALDGGQNGFIKDITVLASSTPHVQNPARIVITRFPNWMDNHTDSTRIKQSFTHLIETHAESWTGFNIESTIALAERLNGWDGQVAKAPTTRMVTPITPVAAYKAIGEGVDINFWNYYMDTAVVSADRQSADYGELIEVPATWTMMDFTFDLLVWEPNSTFVRARWAMAIGGLFPSSPIPIVLDRVVSDARKERAYTVTFEGGIYDHSNRTREAATAIEVSLNVNRIKMNTKVNYFIEGLGDIDNTLDVGLLASINAH